MSRPALVHVLLFDVGSDQEGIHSLEVAGRTIVLLFETHDDASCYAGLLEAQDFPAPSVEAIERDQIEAFCAEAGYEARHVPRGFQPDTLEDRLLLAPPERNMDVSNWREQQQAPEEAEADSSPADPSLEAFRRRLEALL
ncbi:MAG: DUF3110 domain-containing protein [Synechococcaceae cyanobacterium]|nr:DUF3110 domain-containing protein [Synechococcaceae cyanobacterium]